MITKFNNFINESVRDQMTPKSKEDIKKDLSKTSSEHLLGKLSDMDLELTDVFTKDEILELDPEVLLEYSFRKNYIEGIKYVLDNYKLYGKNTKFIMSCFMPDIKDNKDLKYLLNQPQVIKFLNDNQLYVLEKYRLGMHQGETREFEEVLIDALKNATYFRSEQDPDIDICEEKPYEIYYNYNRKTHELTYHFDHLAGYLKYNRQDWSSNSKYGFGARYDDLLIRGIVEEFTGDPIDKVGGARGDRPKDGRPGKYDNFVWENLKSIQEEKTKQLRKDEIKYLNRVERKKFKEKRRKVIIAKRKNRGSQNDVDVKRNQILNDQITLKEMQKKGII